MPLSIVQLNGRWADESPMIMRPLTGADIPALGDLAALSEAEGFRFLRRFIEDVLAGRAQLDSNCEFFRAATVQQRIVAVGGVTRDPYIDDPRIGRLRHIYVRPDSRRHGIGRVLVAHLEAGAAQCYSRLRLRTDTIAAARFYERLGYEPIADQFATHQRSFPSPSARRQPDERRS